ncbi:unnamed protein product [Adineta steineri]|uniref:NAD(P)(+)--arginine ADP-ribosyltransferase n=1 Tax=Adineta steineri TaxID=433720 RepID=A0A819VWE4_9BILA|nr:unnamed protein product [Adineta steineri]CAF4114833.1 unnamed protein product [Adineta steineri]
MSGSVSNQPATATSKLTTSSNIYRPRQRIAQNYLLLWEDTNIDETNEDYENILKQIRTITGDVNVFTQRDACIDFLTDAQEEIPFFLVVKDNMSQQIMSLINDIPQLDSIYIFNNTETLCDEWTKKWQKIKSVHNNIDDICQELQVDVKQHNQDSIAMSFITVNEMASADNLNQLEPTFMYTQLFKEILLDLKYDQQSIKDFITFCRQNNSGSPININLFEKQYQAKSAIWWYTYPSFIYSMLNDGLRFMEGDTIINMGFFIHDLHQQIRQLYQQQVNSYHSKPFLVYRGQGLMKSDFDKLQETKGGLMSFNNFLSTSKDKQVSLEYAVCASTKPDTVGILFIMSIDPCLKSTPFASIEEKSYFKGEKEILFSMHTVFRVSAIKQMDDNTQLYQVALQLTSDDDQQLRLLTDRIREEASGDTGWQRLGKLLLKIGQFNKAEEFYNVLLEQTTDESEKGLPYNQLGFVHWNQGDYEKAICYNEKAIDIRQNTLPSNHPDLAHSYNNIGLVYHSIGEYSKALSFFEKALEIREKTLPSNHPDLAYSYNNIGLVYHQMGEYLKTLSYYEKALKFRQNTLPSNHPDLAQSYNNIGHLYRSMGEYLKALSSHEKALEIYQKTLAPDHPSLATSYNNIGMIYNNMGEYSKALSSHEKALEIYQKTLAPDHPSLATSYCCIGNVYNSMGGYSKALSSHEKALEIYQKTLPSDHPNLATLHNNIGMMCSNIGEYSKAVSFYEKALEIRQKTLAPDHPALATSYCSIGNVYNSMGGYSKALSSHEKALEIRQKTLAPDHPSLATSYNNIGLVYNNMGEYSKALSSHEKALEIREKALPSNHPDLAQSYNNIANVYVNMGAYSKALSFHEKALEIRVKALPSNHPDLATSYNNIGLVYDNMGEYSKALSFHEKALEIREKALPSNHPVLAQSYNNIGMMYDNMEDYSKALSYFEHALDIFQRALPSTHPHIKIVKNNIEDVKRNYKE